MAEHEVKIETDDEIRNLFSELFDKLSKGLEMNLTPQMEATLKRVLEDEDLISSIPCITDIVYHIFVMKELHGREMDSRLSSMFTVNFAQETIDPFLPLNQKTFDPHTLRMQSLKLKEIITDKVIFI